MGDPVDLPDDPLAAELDAFVEDRRLAERGRALDREPEFPRAEFRAMGAGQLLGLSTPSVFGGRHLPIPRVGVLLHRLAYRTGTAFAKLSLQPEFSSVLRDSGSAALRDEWYRPMVAGRKLVGNQVTEPVAGSDLRGLRTEARREGAEYVLDGEKSEVAFATEADAAIVYARVSDAAGDGVTAFLVPQEGPGISRQVIGTDLGERWQRRGAVTYRGVRVPEGARLGAEGAAFSLLRSELTRERALLAAIYLGVARASWAETVQHVGTRVAFGRPLASQQAVAFPLVEDGADLDAAWLYVERTLARLGGGSAADAEAALAKATATRVAQRVLDHAIQFHGGRGYSNQLPHEQRWRDVRSGSIAHGPTELLLRIGARHLWPRPAPSPQE
jgi:alkylation response protein AidB-like acyl-CoA dehydrogenase